MAKEINDIAIIPLPRVRLSFPHLFKAHAMQEGAEAKYSVVLLFDNNKHSKLLDKIEQIAERLALDEFKKKIRLTRELLRDGNEKSDMDGYGDGVTFLTASRKTRPIVVDAEGSPITEDDNLFYAGCYADVVVRLWVQNNQWGKSVNCELRTVRFAGDGESFGAGNINAEDDLAMFDSDNGPASSPRSSRSTRGGSSGKTTSVDDY